MAEGVGDEALGGGDGVGAEEQGVGEPRGVRLCEEGAHGEVGEVHAAAHLRQPDVGERVVVDHGPPARERHGAVVQRGGGGSASRVVADEEHPAAEQPPALRRGEGAEQRRVGAGDLRVQERLPQLRRRAGAGRKGVRQIARERCVGREVAMRWDG